MDSQPMSGPAAGGQVLDIVFLPTSGMADQQAYWQAHFQRWALGGVQVRQVFWPSVLDDEFLTKVAAGDAGTSWHEFRSWREFQKKYRRVLAQAPVAQLMVLSGQNAATKAALEQADFGERLKTILAAATSDVVFPLADGPEEMPSAAAFNTSWTSKLLQKTWIQKFPGIKAILQAWQSRQAWWGAWSKAPHPLTANSQRLQVLGPFGQKVFTAGRMRRLFLALREGLSGTDEAFNRAWSKVQVPWRCLGTNLLIALFWILVASFCWAIMFGSFQVGDFGQVRIAPKNFSDFVSHISLIRSFSEGYNYPVEYPLFTGEPIRYHYLYFWVVALLEKLGGRIDIVFNLLSMAGVLFLCGMIYKFSTKIFRLRIVGIVAVVFFLFHGALVIIDFLNKNPIFIDPRNWADIVDWFQHNRDWISFGPWNGSEISAFWNFSLFNNQRHLAYALGLSLLFIYRIAQRARQAHPPLGEIFAWALLISIMPVFHQPTVLIFAVLLIYFFIVGPHRQQILLCGLLAAGGLLLVNQFWFHFVGDHTAANLDFSGRKTGSGWSLIWTQLFHPFYLMKRPFDGLHFFTYWLKNLGLHLFLIPLGVYLAPRRWRRYWVPALVVFILGNTMQFSREMAGQHKLFNFFLVLSLPFSAAAMVGMVRGVRQFKWWILRGMAYVVLGVVFIVTIQGGLFDNVILWRDCHSYKYDWPNSKMMYSVSSWIKNNSKPDDKFITNIYLFNPVSLVGRRIFLGWPYFAWSAGHDTRTRTKLATGIYSTKDFRTICHFLHNHHLAWFYVQENRSDRNFPKTRVQDYVDILWPDFYNSSVKIAIYARDTICKFAESNLAKQRAAQMAAQATIAPEDAAAWPPPADPYADVDDDNPYGAE